MNTRELLVVDGFDDGEECDVWDFAYTNDHQVRNMVYDELARRGLVGGQWNDMSRFVQSDHTAMWQEIRESVDFQNGKTIAIVVSGHWEASPITQSFAPLVADTGSRVEIVGLVYSPWSQS